MSIFKCKMCGGTLEDDKKKTALAHLFEIH